MGQVGRGVELADGFTQSLLEELDYTIEADNMAAVAAAGEADQVAIPHVYADLSSATVLVMIAIRAWPRRTPCWICSIHPPKV